MVALTLEGRLLCCSECTYSIANSGILNQGPNDIYYEGAGFISPPRTFVGGFAGINSCLIGTNSDGIVVAFRGTMPFDIHRHQTLLDWLNDCDADPKTVTGYPGQVHSGFSRALQDIWDPLFAHLTQLRQNSDPNTPVFVTGHSKGGAMAALAAWRLTSQGIPCRVITFAAPRPADATFRDAYDLAVRDHIRYEYADDIVPHLPPSQDGLLNVLSSLPVVGAQFSGLQRFDFEHVGKLKFINSQGNLEDNPNLRVARNLSLVTLIVRLRFGQIATDHSIGCGSGYMGYMCPTNVCPTT